MPKKIIIALAVILFSAIVSANAGVATAEVVLDAGPIMTRSGVSSEETEPFEWDETPYVFMSFYEPIGYYSTVSLIIDWYSPNSTEPYSDAPFYEFSNGLNIWEDLPNWNTDREPGDWTVDVWWTGQTFIGSPPDIWPNGFPTEGTDSTSFTVLSGVVPEPLSCLLFVVGGAALTASYQRKKKRKK